MPDELDPMNYYGRPYDELVNLLRQRDSEAAIWRERWRTEQQRRIELEKELGKRP